jgi:predicted RNA-binding protein
MSRIETKHLFSENTSPNIKRIVMMKRSGIPLSKRDEEKLTRFSESVSMTLPPPKHERDRVQKSMIRNGNDISDIEDEFEDDIDLDEILREMGYEEEDEEYDIDENEDEEYNIQTMTSSEIKELIKTEVQNYFDNTFENPDELDLNEIIENLTKK